MSRTWGPFRGKMITTTIAKRRIAAMARLQPAIHWGTYLWRAYLTRSTGVDQGMVLLQDVSEIRTRQSSNPDYANVHSTEKFTPVHSKPRRARPTRTSPIRFVHRTSLSPFSHAPDRQIRSVSKRAPRKPDHHGLQLNGNKPTILRSDPRE